SSRSGSVTFGTTNSINIYKTFVPLPTGSTTTYTTTGSTILFGATTNQTIPAFQYYNLTASAGVRTLASSGTIYVANTFTPGTNAYTNTGSTIEFNGAAAQSIPAFAYFNNLTVSGTNRTGSVTFSGANT